jgi:SAM-dependent methyltransferase
MTDEMKRTQVMLAKHHRNGEQFARLMKETFTSRYDEAFWLSWEEWVAPALSTPPVVLDLGTGPGLFLKTLAKAYPGVRAIGVECAPYMLNAIGELPAGCDVVTADLHDPTLPIDSGSVDVVVASGVLHEMNQPVRALQEAYRCLRPGGRIMIVDWVRGQLERYLRDAEVTAQIFDRKTTVEELNDVFLHFTQHNRFSREDLAYILSRCGFEVLSSAPMRNGRFGRLVAIKY